MKNKLNAIVRFSILGVAVSLVLCLLSPLVLADGGDGAAVINTVPRVFSQQAVQQTRGENTGVPWFSGTGTIGKVVENGYIVNDVLRVTGSPMQYGAEATGQALPSSSFKSGVKVGYVLDKSGQLTSLWLLKKQ